MQKVVFVFPYRGVGGVPVLFLRLAERLAQLHGFEISIVDYPDGNMASAPRPPAVALIPYADDTTVALPEEALVVLQAMTPWSVFPSLRFAPQTRLFFWNLHPFNLVPAMPGLREPMQSNLDLARVLLHTALRGYRNRMVRFTRFLLDRQALAFMDQPNLINTENYLGVKVANPRFLPVCGGDPAPLCPPMAQRDRVSRGLHCCWIGRVADFKIHILRRSLRDLDRLQPSLGVPIDFTIIGAGPYVGQLQSEVFSNIKIDFIGDLALAEVAPFLRRKVDLLFAMGTSALEGAAQGIPTILLDVAYAPVPEGYCYRWLFERTGYTLGDVLTPAHIRLGESSLESRLKELLHGPQAIAERTHRYYRENHAPDATIRALLNCTAESKCYYADYEKMGFARADFVYEAFAAMRKRVVRR